MPSKPVKQHPTIAACGLDCGLCPRHYTTGSSRCPGCGDKNFFEKHPSCGILTCCVTKHGVEVCALCSEFPCPRIQKNLATAGDSFMTYQNVGDNLKLMQEKGLEHFLAQQGQRIAWLERVLREFDDGRSKTTLCLAATLLPLPALEQAIATAIQTASAESTSSDDKKTRARILITELQQQALTAKVTLKLRK